jgi:hypothetical protein
MLESPAFIRNREYEAYAALTMCRALYALEYGEIVSKPIAARWAIETTGGRWAMLIDRAVAWPHEPQPDSLNDTLEFIRYTVDKGADR